MTKESGEPESTQLRASSVPSRQSTLPSTPPSTEEIDTDWGSTAEPPPAVVQAPPAASLTTRPTGARSPRLSQTLLGIAPPLLPMPGAAPPSGELAPRNTRLRSQTLIGMAPTLPSPPAPPGELNGASVESAPRRPPFGNPPPPSATALSAAPLARPKTPMPIEVARTGMHDRSVRARRALLGLGVVALIAVVLGYVTWHPRKSAVLRREPAAGVITRPPAPGVALEPAAARAADAAASVVASADRLRPGTVTVTVNTVPPKGKFFHFGRQVGTAPFVVELKPGEQHAYEVFLPGHVTRKVLVDGSKPTITLGLREKAAR